MANNEIDEYCSLHSTPESPLLAELTRQTHLKVLNPRMLSGHVQGLFLKMIVQLLKPTNVLEIGTFTGYSSICIAESLPINGRIHTIEVNDEIALFAQQFFARAECGSRIISHVGDAKQIIQNINEIFQLAFIDGDKREYIAYYNLVMDKLDAGGFILADNVLWDGHVLDKNIKPNDHQTRGIVAFNRHVADDERVENAMLPLRDGITLIRKK